MQTLHITRHARQRMQQRAISQQAIKLLLQFGHVHYDHQGSQILYFDKKSRRRLALQQGIEKHLLERMAHLYLVKTREGMLLTAGHRNKRISRL